MVLGPGMTTTIATPDRTGGTDSSSTNGFAVLASAPLPTLGGDSLQKPSWQRSIQELGAANMKFSSYSAAHALPSADAQLLLGSKTDFGLLSNTGSTSDRGKSSYGGGESFSFDTMSGGGIQEVVERHRDGILQRILKDQREQTRRLLDEKVEHHLQQTWTKEREWWKKNLVSNRNLIDSTNTSGNGSSAFGTEGGVVGVGKSGGLLLGDGSSYFTSSIYAAQSDPKAIKDHFTVVQSIGSSSDYEQFIRKFEKVALADIKSTMYQTAWQLLGSVLPNMQTPVRAAVGAEFHFCRQYQHYVTSQVKSASLNGQDVSTTVQYSNGMAGKIASFVKLVSGSNASIWEVLYYCKCSTSIQVLSFDKCIVCFFLHFIHIMCLNLVFSPIQHAKRSSLW
jgi:hypothetical protein